MDLSQTVYLGHGLLGTTPCKLERARGFNGVLPPKLKSRLRNKPEKDPNNCALPKLQGVTALNTGSPQLQGVTALHSYCYENLESKTGSVASA